jgi:hypothetical protein
MMRSWGLLLASVVGCHRAPPPAPEKQPDPVSVIPATGPLVLLSSGQIGEDRAKEIAPWLIDPETGATHRLADLDASCESALQYVTLDDGRRHLYSFNPIWGWSRHRAIAERGSDRDREDHAFRERRRRRVRSRGDLRHALVFGGDVQRAPVVAGRRARSAASRRKRMATTTRSRSPTSLAQERRSSSRTS